MHIFEVFCCVGTYGIHASLSPRHSCRHGCLAEFAEWPHREAEARVSHALFKNGRAGPVEQASSAQLFFFTESKKK